jgi:dihydrofolate reductase
MSRIAFVVAVDRNNVIGKDGRLPWHLSDDLKYVRKLTTGKPLIMGRKTYDSIGRPLPNRTNIVLTRDPSFRPDGVLVASTPQQALALAGDAPEIIVFGGAQIFDLFRAKADRIYLTKVDAESDGDTFFSFEPREWRVVEDRHHDADAKHAFAFDWLTLDRIPPAERAP